MKQSTFPLPYWPRVVFAFWLLLSCQQKAEPVQTQPETQAPAEVASPIVGAARFDQYLEKLVGKRVALTVNQTSMVGNSHLVDTLLAQGVQIKKIFAPEHGFRGDADAGAKIDNSVDAKTGLPLLSLYGKTKKPTPEFLADIDVVIFDIQDVGARFYTYISTMHYVMEACAEQGKQVVVLDRPNPNGDYVDGPVLQKGFESFVGMHPIPVVHGLTVGELAQMINGEKWLPNGLTCDLTVIPCANYDHKTPYSLPVRPSPNLPNDQAIQLYPSICFFEGTDISLGRGTPFPFQAIGGPNQVYGSFEFTPVSTPGAATNPPHQDRKCYGLDLRNTETANQVNISYLIEFVQKTPDKKAFFSNSRFFNLLAGNDTFQRQLVEGKTEAEIRSSWASDLAAYRMTRKNTCYTPTLSKQPIYRT